MNPWAHGAPVPLLLQLFYVVAMTLIAAAIGALLIFVARAYHAYFYPPEKKLLVHINCHGIHFFRGKNRKRTLHWQDLRAARVESISSGKGGITYYLAIHDRLDREYWIYIGLPQSKQRFEEIAAIINAILADKPLPNIMPAVAVRPTKRTLYWLFWLNTVSTLLMCLFFLINGKALPETTRDFFCNIFYSAIADNPVRKPNLHSVCRRRLIHQQIRSTRRGSLKLLPLPSHRHLQTSSENSCWRRRLFAD